MISADRSGPTRSNRLRVALIQRVCAHYRVPIFARLSAHPEIELTVFHSRGIPGTKVINAERISGFTHRELWSLHGWIWAGGRTTPWVVCPTVWWALLQHDPDVIVTEGGSNILTNLFVYAYAVLFRKPIVWWTLGELPGRYFLGIRRLYRATVRAMERRATALLGYSSLAMEYFARMGYPREKCFRAVNCVDTDRVFAEIEQRHVEVPILRRRLGLEGRRVILFVGALTAEKQVDRLVRAFARIHAEFPDARLLVVGDGPERERLTRLAAQLGCGEATIFTGQIISGVSDYFELADVVVLPGLGGLVISEALAHGVPVICAQGDGCEIDLVREGKTGFRLGLLPDEQAIDGIVARLRELFNDPERLAQMRSAARTLIQQEFNVHTYVAAIVDAIRFAYRFARRRPPEDSDPQAKRSRSRLSTVSS